MEYLFSFFWRKYNCMFAPLNKKFKDFEMYHIRWVIPFPCHFPFVSTAIFPYLIIANNITLGIFSLSICFWWSRLHSFSLWSTLFVIETRRSCPPCWVRKSTRGFCPNSPRFPFRHALQEFPAQLSIQVVLFLLSEGWFNARRKTSAKTQ